MSKFGRHVSLETRYPYQTYRGEIEFIIRDRLHQVVDRIVEPNIVKIFAKEILAFRAPHSRIWDPEANSGLGDWVASGIDPAEDFSLKYILFGASFDDDGIALEADDPRFYVDDPVTGIPVPVRLDPGAGFEGGLINAIPISEPGRPLKRIERIAFEPTFQPAGTPLLQDDVRAMNNILILETTLELDEYNGFGVSGSDVFTITEVGLAAAKELDVVGSCEKDPKDLFLEKNSEGRAIAVNLSGGDVVSIDSSEDEIDLIKQGDQVKLVALDPGTDPSFADILDQINPFYLVVSKQLGGRDIQLDRVPEDSERNPLIGQAGLLRSTLRLFSHRILKSPVKKTGDFEIIVRWRILFN